MNILKNKFFIILIIAVLAGGILGVYLAGTNKANAPTDNSTNTSENFPANGTTKNEKINDAGDVLKKLDELAK